VLDDEMLAAYQAGVTDADRVEFEEWLGVSSVKCSVSSGEGALTGGGGDGDGPVIASSRIYPALETENLKLETRKSHLVSATLFWKHVNARDPELPRPTREMLVDAKRMGLVKRFAPWDRDNSDLSQQVRYRPILGGHFGARGGISVRELIEAFIWHWRHGSLPNTAKIPGIGERPIQFSEWPNYGFEEVSSDN
jgi:hypothetical protein